MDWGAEDPAGWRVCFQGAGPWISLSSHTEFQAWKNISLEADSALETAQQRLGRVWGWEGVRVSRLGWNQGELSRFDLEKLWSSPGSQEFLSLRSDPGLFIYPWLYLSLSWGLTQQQKCKQWILGGLDTTTAGLLSLLWVDPLGSTNSQPFPFCQQPLAPGANVSFGFPVPVARLGILPGGALGPGLFSWRIEEEGAAGKCHNCLGSVLTRFVLVTLPAGGQSQYWHNGKIIINTSSISKFPFRITRFLKSTEEVEAKFGYFWEK